MDMRFRLGLVTGLATGYYLGARAGRQRYDQINRLMRRVRRTEAFQTVVEDAKSAVGEGVEKARSALHHNAPNNGHSEPSGTELPGDYSSSR